MSNIAIVTIGFESYALPHDKAVKALQALTGAVRVDRKFSSDFMRHKWVVGRQVEVGLQTVASTEQFVTEDGERCDLKSRARPMPRDQAALPAPSRKRGGA